MNHPNSIVKDMYLEITNVAQGVNIAILVYVISTQDSLGHTLASWLLILTSFLIVIIFWIRYYFDTEILGRSFTILSAGWFFVYEVVQGVSISSVDNPPLWFLTTGLFLFMGSGFYWINLQEIRRKEKARVLKVKNEFIQWQKRRMVELLILAFLAIGISLLLRNSSLSTSWISLLASASLGIAFWQTVITNDYRRKRFLDVGI